MPTIDLYSRIIPNDHNVYFVRPGKEYKLYLPVIESSTILADLPSLDLEIGVPLNKQKLLINKIHRSRAIRKWYREKQEGDNPSRDLGTYPDTVRDLGISQLKFVVERYFDQSKKGDLIIVLPGPYTSDAYIGELQGDPADIISLSFEQFYDGEPLLGRKVNWLARTQKKNLADPILEIGAKPNAFVLLPNEVRRSLYELAYPGYITSSGTSSRFDVTKNEYTSFDDLVIQAFFNFVASNTKAVAEGRAGDVRPFNTAAFIEAGEFTPDLRTDISSPGFLNLSSKFVTPLVVAALLVAAIEIGAPAFTAAESGTLRIGNTLASPDDACVADIERLALTQIVLLGAEGWAEACEKARRAADRNGLKGPAKVKR